MIRKVLFLLGLIGSVVVCYARPEITGVSFSTKVNVYGMYEISFNLGSYANPYDPEVVDVHADFVSPEGNTFRVNGFYYESYNLMEKNSTEVISRSGDGDGWRIRFSPNAAGKWTFIIYVVDRTGTVQLTSYQGKPMAFDCLASEAEGFIKRANTKYLKREVYTHGQRQYRSYFPVGPNIAWYRSADYGKFRKPYGIFEYKNYIDVLSGNANYMRIWLNRYQYLSLYGPEHSIRDNGKPVVYFDSDMNQKDSAELDFIVSYAADHGIALMPCVFSFGDFRDDSEAVDISEKNVSMPSSWMYNPYHTILKLERPVEFFTDPEAKRISRNLLRYIVARWGYATNIVAWELWNEVANIFKDVELDGSEEQAILDWHREMASWIRSLDPYGHLVTTSLGTTTKMTLLKDHAFDVLDVVQDHNYQNIQKRNSAKQMSHVLYMKSNEMRELYPDKPCFMGEYGLKSPLKNIGIGDKDPKGIDLHNSLWASFFSGSMGTASYWYWRVLSECNLFGRFKPMKVFSDRLPVLSDTFQAETTGYVEKSTLVCPNNLLTYYLINAEEDTLLGWSQDTAFCYQSLRYLTDQFNEASHFNETVFDPKGYVYTLDEAKKPGPSSRRNAIEFTIVNQPRRTRYSVRWFDAETGLEMPDEATTAVVRRRWFRKVLTIQFPSSIRGTDDITNTFGDAVFMVTKISD